MHDQLDKLLADFNAAWTQGKLEGLHRLLHPQVVFMAPDLTTKAVGQESCIQTIRDYIAQASTLHFEVRNQDIMVWGTTAVILLDYYIEYAMKGARHKEHGKESWTAVEHDGHWKIAWRAMVAHEQLS